MRGTYRPGLPTRAALGPTGLHLVLRDIPPSELRDPFMQETITRVPSQQAIVEIPRGELDKAPPGSAPAGLIFHVARCGSTLASQLLKLHKEIVVYSEPQPMNELLIPPHAAARSELIKALRALGSAFARHAGRPYVLKLTSWNTIFCDVIAEAFPTTPWALCIRDPLEVCVSLLGHQPGWLHAAGPGRQLFTGAVDPKNSSRSDEEYIARAYAAFCNAASRLDTGRGKLIRYERLPQTVWQSLTPHFGLSADEQLQQRMLETSRQHAKAPLGVAAAFVPDAERKRAAASSELRAAVEVIARPALDRVIAGFPAGG